MSLLSFPLLFGHATPCGILVPHNRGLNLHPLYWKHGMLTTGQPGKSLVTTFDMTNTFKEIEVNAFTALPVKVTWHPTKSVPNLIGESVSLLPGKSQTLRYLRTQEERNLPKLKAQSGRRQWHPTPVLLPRKSHGRKSLVGCSPWGHSELDTTEGLHFHFSLSCIGEGNGNSLQNSCLENPRDGEPGGLPSMGSHRVGHD